jgi:uncharacterized oligopeptide transporter (OPT) family protein
MAPDRGSTDIRDDMDGHSDAASVLSSRAQQPQNFTLRSLLLGLAIGTVICFSNTYFGLQTGWVSSMAMPSALLGFAWFKAVSRTLSYPFTPVENVLVQSVAGSVGTMPLGCGFVGVIPALEYLLKPDETQGEGTGVHLSLTKLIVWAVGICFFGVVFAVPLRRQVIIREKLKFPSGTATALMIGVLHGGEKDASIIKMDNENAHQGSNRQVEEEEERLNTGAPTLRRRQSQTAASEPQGDIEALDEDSQADWKGRIKLLTLSFGMSAIYVRIHCNLHFLILLRQFMTSFRELMHLPRLSCPTLFPSFARSLSWACTWQKTGSGRSTLRPHISAKASSWVLQPLCICS